MILLSAYCPVYFLPSPPERGLLKPVRKRAEMMQTTLEPHDQNDHPQADTPTEGAGKCPFVHGYLQAHDTAGLNRMALSGFLRTMASDPASFDRPEGRFCASWVGMDVSVMTAENAERISANLLVSFLLQDFQPYLQKRLSQIREARQDLYSGVARQSGHYPDEIQELYFQEIRTASCDTFNAWVNQWISERHFDNARLRQEGKTPDAYGIAIEQALRFFPLSPLYTKANHTFASLVHSGSCTALHVCWSLLEAAAYQAELPTTADYVALILRSRKNILPLAIGSLGMVVTYLNNSHLHPHDGRAVHATHHGQDGIVLDHDKDGQPILTMNPAYIQPFLHGENVYYTGCPAFYVTGLIETYLEACTELAAFYNMFRTKDDSRS